MTAKTLKYPIVIIAELRAAGAGLEESMIAPGAWRFGDGTGEIAGRDTGAPQAGMPALLRRLSDEGLIYFQDEGSQLVAHLLGAQDSERVLDVCAAPGSKSTLIGLLAPQSEIIACDLYEHRVQTMRRLAAQQDVGNIHFAVHDATKAIPFAPGSFNRVIVDAPCSGTGTLRHNPEIRWRLRPSDLPELADKQKLILKRASDTVSRGGLLLYSTCSLETEENEEVAADFLEHHGDFELARWPARADLVTNAGAERTWSHRHGADGFFAMAFRRKH
jgi:16S rRNA (cytosine967-C5)-methyltransferase